MSAPSAPGARPPEQRAIWARAAHPAGVFVPFGKDETEQSIPTRFDQVATRHPLRVAVAMGPHALTYAELREHANRIAHALLRHGGEGTEPVAILLHTHPTMIASLLGALKAGKFFVPLSPVWPPARIESVLRDSQARALLTDASHRSVAEALRPDGCRLIDVDALESDLPADDPGLALSPDDLSYVVYTSGSTGHPKGVMQNHRNGLHEAMLYVNGLRLCAEDRLALLYSCHASQGLKITLAALLGGTSLHVFDLAPDGVHQLTPWLDREAITVCFSIPAVFRQWASSLAGRAALPALRIVQLGSDAVSRADVTAYRTCCPAHTVLVIRLGSTEAGTIRTCYFDRDSPAVEGAVPVGYPVDDTEVWLRGEDGTVVPPGEVGEIAVRSRYLSAGYWRQPDMTRERFVPDPRDAGLVTHFTGDLGRMGADGCLHHLGRRDFQVKIRGHRVEVAEIESALLALTSIREAVVVPQGDRETPRLVAYVVPAARPAPSSGELCAALAAQLPDYMVPVAFVPLDRLPLTAAGKVDRSALPAPGPGRPELAVAFAAPRNTTEHALASIWAEVLGLDEVGIHDPFLDLGGHSLAAVQVASRIIERFDLDVSIALLLEVPTVADLAAILDGALRAR